jgi:hypothetical protein
VNIPVGKIPVLNSGKQGRNSSVASLPDKWLKSLKKYQKLDVDKVVPGHGSITDKSCFAQMYKVVTIWIDTVADTIAKGMTLEEAQDKVTMFEQCPDMPQDERTSEIVRMNVTRICETLKNKKSNCGMNSEESPSII